MKLIIQVLVAVLLTGVPRGQEADSPSSADSLVEQACAAMEASKSISMTVKARLEHREGALRDSRLGKDKGVLTGEATVVSSCCMGRVFALAGAGRAALSGRFVA